MFLNRFLFLCHLTSPIAASGFLACSIAQISGLFLVNSILFALFFLYSQDVGYKSFNFKRIEREFNGWILVFDAETQGRYDEWERIVSQVEDEWATMGMAERQLARNALRSLLESEKDLSPSEQVFEYFQDRLKHIYF